jgi:subtilase family serine protease
MKVLILLSLLICSSYSEWVKIGNTNHPVTFHIALKQNEEGLSKVREHLLYHSSNIESPLYGNYLSKEEINKMVSPSKDTVHTVSKWLRDNKLHNCEYMNDAFKCVETTDKVNSAFKVNMNIYHNKFTNQRKLRSDVSYQLPSHLKNHIDFIDGLSNKLSVHEHLKRTSNKISVQGRLNKDVDNKISVQERLNKDVDNSGFSREVMLRLYDVPLTLSDPQVSVGAIAYVDKSNGFSNKDLLLSQAGNNVLPNPISKEHLVGLNSDNPDGESELDVQTIYWGAPNATLWYENFEGWMYGWAVDFFNRQNVPDVVSISYGFSEKDQCYLIACENTTSRDYVTRTNNEFMKLAARGITLVVASGDAGAPGRTNELCWSKHGQHGWNHMNADFPGGSPWVVSVGSTYLVKSENNFKYTSAVCNNYTDFNINCSNGNVERAIFYNKTGWTTGGGFTLWDDMPSWQTNNVKKYFSTATELPDNKYYNSNGRAYPDVSVVGHLCTIVSRDGSGEGEWDYADGTSCSAPVFAGLVTQLNYFQLKRGKSKLGYLNPLLYKMYNDDLMTFNDITEGNNRCTEVDCCIDKDDGLCCTKDFGFLATEGWDPVSGLGSPNIRRIMKYLMNMS